MPSRKSHVIHARCPLGQAMDHITFLQRHRLGVEVSLSAADLDAGEPAKVTDLSSRLAGEGISVSLHAPFVDLSPGSPDAKVQEVSRIRMLQAAEVAAILNPHFVVVHPGYDRWRYGREIQLWLDLSVPMWEEIASCMPKGIPIVFENVFEEHPKTLVELLNALPEDRFGFCFDTGHFNLFSTATMGFWLRKLQDRLITVHLHDNGGLEDEHRPLGEGRIDFSPLKKIFPQKPVWVLEHSSQEEVLISLKKFLSLLDSVGDRAGG